MLAFFGKVCYTNLVMAINLTADQENAKNLIAEWFFNTRDQVFVLAGYAGTGKTFLIEHVVKNVLFLEAGKEAVFVSPTGKAAVNIIQKGTLASTVHSLIYIRNEDEFLVDENGEILPDRRLSFYKRDQIDPNIQLIIIDEASMINEEVLRDLLSFNVKCLFSGDGAQLPPVNGLCPLMAHPHYTLTEIVRQAQDDPIVQVATMARLGKNIPFGRYGENVVVRSRNSLSYTERKRLFLEADQIICGRNATRNDLNAEMRMYLGYTPSQALPEEGEKVICTLNDWEKPLDTNDKFHLVNGIIGYCSNVTAHRDFLGVMDFRADFLPNSVQVAFDAGVFYSREYAHGYGERAVFLVDGTVAHENDFSVLRKIKTVKEEQIARFEFAYAVTCHKAQGSEFDFVIVFDESYVFGEERYRWLYTAITRAKKRLLILR